LKQQAPIVPSLPAAASKIDQPLKKLESERKLDYSYTMNHKLAANFLGDAFMSNTNLAGERLEGSNIKEVSCFIREALTDVSLKNEMADKENNPFASVQRHFDDV